MVNRIGNMIKIINDHCLDILPTFKDDSVDLVFTSPPYNIGAKGKNIMYTEYIDYISDKEYYRLLSVSLIECLRICRGPIFYVINYMVNNKKVLYQWISNHSEYLRENIIWDKGRVQPPIGNILAKRYEYILMFTKDPKFEINNFRINKAEKYCHIFGNWISNLIILPVDYENFYLAKTHRAGFPEKLPGIFIDIYTKEGDMVLDPFLGLGSTAVASAALKRNFIGIELAKKYCDISQEKLNNLPVSLF